MKLTIQRFFLDMPRRHLAKVKLHLDGNPLISIDNMECDSYKETEIKAKAIAHTAILLANKLNLEIHEENKDLTVVESV